MDERIRSDSLTCPKCGGAMRTYERNGISIDQCTECRGVFLDRGELERMIDAEGAAYADRGAERVADRGRQVEGETSGRRKRGGFLGDLFELGE